jgi:TRAP-type mannitol/chloroaromatic compound transport system permease small subunit
MTALLGISRLIDRVTEIIGKSVSWLILVAVLVSAANAIIRKIFNMSSNAWLEAQWYLFGAAFMLAAAYTLSQNEHIRIDVVYGKFSRRVQHWIDLFGHVVFLMPFVLLRSLAGRLIQRWWPDRLASQGNPPFRLHPSRAAGRFGDHQEDRDHDRQHG